MPIRQWNSSHLLNLYNAKKTKTLDDLLDFHVHFERIHPFQDGNGRIGRLILFKECLAAGIAPFIITEDLKMFYYRGLQEWRHLNGYLTDTCLTAQDQYKAFLDYFRIDYSKEQLLSADEKGIMVHYNRVKFRTHFFRW